MEGRGGGRERKGEVDVRETDKESDRGGGGGEREIRREGEIMYCLFSFPYARTVSK